MYRNSFGEIEFNENDLFDLIYKKDLDLTHVKVDNATAERFNQSKKLNFDSFQSLKSLETFTGTVEEFDKLKQSQWLISDFKVPNLKDHLYELCRNQQEKDRVTQEWELFAQHNMIDLLHFLKYLVEKMREHNIVWGVGRGSSVASFILYLLGVHKINSIKYNLDMKEFLK